jgi:tetratricopeptide (TPR) repeat protein
MDKTKLGATGKYGGAKKAEQTSALPKGTSARRRADIKMVQNVLLIWLDTSIDVKSEDCRNTISQLRRVVNTVHAFNDTDQCIDFLTDICNENVLMIISGALCKNIVSLFHAVTQLHTIFIFCEDQTRYERWANEWSKIRGVFTKITLICEVLEQASQQCEQNAISISFVSTSGDASSKSLDRLDPMFMYTQIMKEILLAITFEQKHFKEFIDYCHDIFDNNEKDLKNIDKLEQNYPNQTPVWWYTCQCFLYPMLNRALRMSDVDIIIRMGFFIDDLHRQIEELHKKQYRDHQVGKILTVYRGQGLFKADFQKMKETKGGLMSFNNFLSTSEDRAVSLAFAESNESNPDLVGILFVMTIDPSKSTTPFASINGITNFPEEDEILFSMHTVFRIHDIKSMGENQRLIQVDLTLTGENDDKDLRELTDCIREETFPDEEGWLRLGAVLYKMGQFQKSQQVFEVLLEQATDDSGKAPIYNQLGLMKDSQGEYKEAITFCEKALDIYKKTLPSNHPNLAGSYNNIGLVYCNMGEYSKALSYYEKVLEIQQQSFPSNHRNLAASYNNIGAVYYNMGEYSKALSSYEKALEISQQSLPSNHPDLASSYNNIGSVYQNMGEYSKALSSYEKALEIRQQSLPSNHSDLAASYNSAGAVYCNMGEYSKALSYFEKALEIQQQSLSLNHPSLASSYNNIGNVYYNMGEYSKALSSYEKALEIQQQSLPLNHPNLAGFYSNIGVVYNSMGEYSKALSYYEKALEIRQQALPSNHPDLASSYSNIGAVYCSMGEYSKARSFFERAVNIGQQSLPSHHPHLQIYRNNLDRIKKKL